jgi:hypothetical protein
VSFRKQSLNRWDTLVLMLILPFLNATLGTIGYAAFEFEDTGLLFFIPLGIAVLLGIATFFLSFFYYIPHHTKDKPKRYFEKSGFVETAKEYRFARKVFYVMAAITILNFLWYYTTGFLIRFTNQQLSIQQFTILTTIFTYFLAAAAMPTVVLAIRFALHYIRKDFGFYLARAYFAVSSQKEDSVKKFKYLRLALDTYNKFLERNLKLKIKDIMRIYSKIMSASTDQKIKMRESIAKAFQEEDKLELARQLSEISSLLDEEEFLVKERTILSQQLKDILTIIIPAIISIVGFIIAMLSQVGIFRT